MNCPICSPCSPLLYALYPKGPEKELINIVQITKIWMESFFHLETNSKFVSHCPRDITTINTQLKDMLELYFTTYGPIVVAMALSQSGLYVDLKKTPIKDQTKADFLGQLEQSQGRLNAILDKITSRTVLCAEALLDADVCFDPQSDHCYLNSKKQIELLCAEDPILSFLQMLSSSTTHNQSHKIV